MNAKGKGARAERRSMRLLESDGYRCTRSAASLGAFEVVGVRETDIALLQVKVNAWPSVAEMEALKRFPAPANARKIVHRWRDRRRLPDVREL